MKKFLTTLIYGTLACIVLIYLFSAMHWPGFENVALGVLWLHVGSYLTYSVVVPEKESRIIYLSLLFINLNEEFNSNSTAKI